MKLKGLLSFLLCLCFVLPLSGCALKEAVSAEAIEYLISSVGFDENENGISVFYEAVIVNSEDTTADKKVELIEGNGKSVLEAVGDAAKKTVHPFMLSHLGVAVIGENISAERFEEICKYCYGEDEITLSMMLVATKNAKALLSCETVSSIAVGYDIMSMLDKQSSRTGIEYKNRFYEVESAREKPLNIIALPFFEVEGESFFAEGLCIYKDNAPTVRLNEKQSFFYAIATDTQSAGEVILDGIHYGIKSSYTTVNFKESTEITALMTVKLRSKGDSLNEKTVEKGIKEVFELSKQYSTDILGIGNILYNRKKGLFEKVKTDYYEKYKDFNLTVEFE